MNDKKLYVIKYSNGWYSCGHSAFSTQLRHAQIYVSKKRASEQAEHYIKTVDRYTKHMIAPTDEYKIIEVEIKEVGEA